MDNKLLDPNKLPNPSTTINETDSLTPDMEPSLGLDVPEQFQDNSAQVSGIDNESFDKAVELEQKYGDSPVRTFLERGASAATLGISDQVLTKYDPSLQEGLNERAERNKASALAGEVVGTVAPALVGGVAAPAAEAGNIVAGLTSRGLSNLIKSTGREALVKDILKKSVPMAAGSSVEGTFYGLGQLVSEDALGKTELNAENVLSAMGTGAVIGGAAGGVLGAGEALLPIVKNNVVTNWAGKKLKGALNEEDTVARYLSSTPAEASNFKLKSPNAAKNAPKFLRENLQFNKADNFESLVSKTSSEMSRIGGEISTTLKQVDDLADSSLLPSRIDLANDLKNSYSKLSVDADTFGATAEQMSRRVKRELDSVNKFFGIDELEAAKSKLVTARNKISQDKDILEDALSKIDVAKNPKKAEDLARRIIDKDGEFIKIERDLASNIKALEERLNTPIKATELAEFKRKQQDLIKWTRDPSAAPIEEQFSRIAVDLLRSKIDDIAGKLEVSNNKSLGEQLKKLNLDYHTAATLLPKLEKKVAKEATSNFAMDYKDTVLGVLAVASGNPLSVGGIYAAKKFAESDIRRQLQILADVERRSKSLNSSIDKAVNGFAKTAGRAKVAAKVMSTKALVKYSYATPERKKKISSKKEAFSKLTDDLAYLQANPEKLAERALIGTQKLSVAAPKMAQAVRERMVNTVSFLHTKLPKDPNPGHGQFAREWEPSSQELAKFERYLEAAENPMSVIDDLQSGTITREAIETIQVLYPELHSTIITRTLNAVKNQKLSYSQKAQMSVLLDIPLDSSLTPESIQQFQQQFAIEALQTSPDQSSAVTSQRQLMGTDVSGRMATNNQRLLEKGIGGE